jgi:Protein of unknown function (DUF1592)/Protein of unknown function (DUF1588)/Protein of unknown function (DUF1587)/Protein of unknown function (DUF1585)/Protein of unknown function (DUF1595)/Planctomycete cytochrome C
MKKAAALIGLTIIWAVLLQQKASSQDQAASQNPAPERALINQYCLGCHNEKTKTAELMLDKLDIDHPGDHAEKWEKVVRKVRAGMMPPSGMPRPDRSVLDAFAAKIEAGLDRTAAANPNPGWTGLHRLNRTEYTNSIRDLLALDIDASTLLPADDSSEGFDNIADALAISPALIERYAAAAIKISRLAVGNPLVASSTVTYRAPSDFSQRDHVEGMPLGTHGGMQVRHTFPVDAQYTIQIRARGGGSSGGGLGTGGGRGAGPSGEQLEVMLNGERVQLVGANGGSIKLNIKAGPQTIAAALVRRGPPGGDEIWQAPLGSGAVSSIAITGPANPTGSGDTPSRRKIFTCTPASPAEESACAKQIITTLARRAYRQPPAGADLDTLLSFYQTARNSGSFENGVEQALARVLMDPRFVFRFEREPANLKAGAAYHVTDLELASRLSFFLWSSIPDEELLQVAIQGKLHEPAVLEAQTRRMLADPKSSTLSTNFGGQWLFLRDLKAAKPESREFNDNLRQAFRRETEMLLETILREDRSVLDLLNADYTFVDETLAKHYGIPNVRGSRFRRIQITDENRRGLLGQGSFLLVTSVATRTSPVARGKWILENMLGTAPPLPPPNVPALPEDEKAQQSYSLREKMEQHRKNPVCSSCHKIMDPIGFSLENFDLTGKWRSMDGGKPIDATSQLVDGTPLNGPVSLRQAILSRSDVFVRTMTEKLMTFGTGRGLKYYDMPAVRSIARDAARNNNRYSSIILGIVKSDPFQMKVKQAEAQAQIRAAAER